MFTPSTQRHAVAIIASVFLCAGCGGGSGSSTSTAGGGTSAGGGSDTSASSTAATTTTTSLVGGTSSSSTVTSTSTTTTTSTTSTTSPPAPVPHTRSSWSPVIDLPIVPVAAANLPNGKVLTWSAYAPDNYGDENAWGQTFSAIFDPQTLTSQQRVVTETQHDMFCPGTTMLEDGKILINGGSSSQKTTFYDPFKNAWTAGAPMNIARGYQGNTILADGTVLTLGGAWSGGESAKNAEVWNPSGWRLLPGIPIAPFIGPDPRGTYRGDNHLWLFLQSNGRVFHAGPDAHMHWIDTSGSGQVIDAGARGNDEYSMNGNAILYDVGKILKVGGAPAYEDVDASAASYIIDLNGKTTRQIAPMHYARAMHNSVVLPNGQVVITGGQTYVKLFSDDRSILMAEIWDPRTEKFSKLSPMKIPRNYHSFSLLLPDGRVLVGGGGLCGACTTNHPNVEILTPPYLLKADGSPASRPGITSAPSAGSYGSSITVTTDSAVESFALVRLSAVTHSVNNDQRRVPLKSVSVDGLSHQLTIPFNRGLLPPGYYMLFALNAEGVPSVSTTLHIR